MIDAITSELVAERERRIAASRRALAALLQHHGASPPDADARAAIAAIRMRIAAPRPPITATFRTIEVRAIPSGASIRDIVAHVAAAHGIAVTEILSDRRRKPVVRARQEAMYLAATQTHHSLPAIGRAFRRDHTTVLHGIRQHADRIGAAWPRRAVAAEIKGAST